MTAVAEPAVMPAESKTSRRGGTRKAAAAGDTSAAPPAVTAGPSAVQLVPVVLLDDHPLNPREELTDLTDLAQSIAEQGLLQNLTVVPSHVLRGDDTVDDGRFTVLIGHRRKAAAAIANVDQVPCVVRRDVTTSGQALQIMLVENLQRVDISPLSEARAYAQLVEDGMSQRDIARRVGRNQSHVSKRLALLKLPAIAQAAVLDGRITIDEGRALLPIADDEGRLRDVLERRPVYQSVEQAVARHVDEIDRSTKVAELISQLKAEGKTYVKTASWDQQLTRLDEQLRDVHVGLPCHAFTIPTWGDPHIEPVCTDPRTHKEGGDLSLTGVGAKQRADVEKARAEAAAAAEKARVEREERLQAAARAVTAKAIKPLEEFAVSAAVAWQLDNLYGDELRPVVRLLGILPDVTIDAPDDQVVEDAVKDYAGKGHAQRIRLLAAMAIDTAESNATYRADPGEYERYERLIEAHGWTRPAATS